MLDSLYRGYPSGAILLWETDEDVPLQEFAIEQQKNPYKSTRLLLDGQQRLTSLSAVIRGEPVKVRGKSKPIELLFNLDHPEQAVVTEVNDDSSGEETLDEDDDYEADFSENDVQRRVAGMTFMVASRNLERQPQWVKVTDVFKTESDALLLRKAGIKTFEDEKYEKYSQRLARLRSIKKYTYRIDVLERHLSYSEVTEIFVRVNSLGAKLRSSDLALAQITAKWRGSLEVFQKTQNNFAKIGFDFDLGTYLKNMVVFATGQSTFSRAGNLPVDLLQKAWKDSVHGMEYALNFLRNNVGIQSPSLLTSPFILIVLAYYAHGRNYQISSEEFLRLRYWVLAANAKGRYSRGVGEMLLDQEVMKVISINFNFTIYFPKPY